jgi:DNA-binding NarL/FixJ family response regulator
MKGSIARALAEDLAPVIGAEAARKLMTALAGREIYVPRHASGHHPIAVAIGDEKAAAFCEYWHGTRLEFPVTPAKRRRILDLSAAGRSNGMIATELMVSERFVRKVLAESRQQDTRQHRLFG